MPHGDLVARLLAIQFLVSRECRVKIGSTLREAASELERHRALGQHTGTRYIDWDRGEVVVGATRHTLIPIQLRLLKVLTDKTGRLVRTSEIIAALWGHDIDGGPDDPSSIIKVYICRLRKVLPWPIRTIVKEGHILEGYKALGPSSG